MENIVLFRLEDDSSVWIADLKAGTVQQTDASAISDQPSVKGIDFAMVARARPTAAGHLMYPST